MTSDDDAQDLHNRIAGLAAELGEWRKFGRVLGDFLRRVGSPRLSVTDARERLQAAMEGRLTVVPAMPRAQGDDDDRNRRIADAQRAVQRGNLQRAIKIYVGLCEQYSDDFRLRLKLGDCYARVGETEKAAATHLEVARHYDAQGFYLKAVAVYKQILRMGERQPEGARLPKRTSSDIRIALVELYERLGLLSDALLMAEEFLKYAEETDERISSVRDVIERLNRG